MNIEKQIKISLKKAVDLAGNQLRLEEKTKVSYSTINMMMSGKRSTGNMTANTLEKLFPELEITFFRNERQAVDSDLSPLKNKIIAKINELDEDAQLELLSTIGGLIAKGRVARKHLQQSVA